jgi:hypothetical protein
VVSGSDHVHRRIVVEYGQLYAYCYMTDGNGKVLEEEQFKQPFRMDRKDVTDEAEDCYRSVWDWLNDTVNVTPLQGLDEGEAQSEEEDTP